MRGIVLMLLLCFGCTVYREPPPPPGSYNVILYRPGADPLRWTAISEPIKSPYSDVFQFVEDSTLKKITISGTVVIERVR